MKKKNLIIFIICYLAYTSIYIARLNLSMASPGLREISVLDESQIGMLGSVFSIVYSLGRLINGYISDKKEPRFMICLGLILAGISNVLFGFFPPFIGMFILWGVNALAQSMLWSSILRIIAAIYPNNIAKKKTSYMVTSVATGNILGIVLNTAIIKSLGLKFAFVVPGLLTLIFSVFSFIILNRIEEHESEKKEHISMLELLKENSIQKIFIPATLHGMIKDNISLWMTVFFVDRYNVDLSKATWFVLFIPLLGFLGRMLYPLCYKLSGEDEHKVSTYSFILCTLFSVILCFSNAPAIIAVISLSLIYTFVSVINTSILSIFPLRFAKSDNIASVSGLMDFATYAGAGISALGYGFLIKRFGYTPMFISWAIISLISVFIIRTLIKRK